MGSNPSYSHKYSISGEKSRYSLTSSYGCRIQGAWMTLIFIILMTIIAVLPAAAMASSADNVSVQLTGVQVPFIENQGQMASQVDYYANTFYGTAYITDDGITHSVLANNSTIVALKEQFIGENGDAIALDPRGENKSQAQVSYFVGNNSADWRTGITTYDLVSLGEIYPDITVKARAHGDNMEKLFYVSPGGNVADIIVRVDGASGLKVLEDGSLSVETGAGAVNLSVPKAFQDGNAVAVSYRVIDENTYGFTVGEYDHEKELLIDPSIAYSTYIVGSNEDGIYGMAVDNQGYVYVCGQTVSVDFPVTMGAYQTAAGGTDDTFVCKLNPSGTGLIYSTYLAGNSQDLSPSIAIDSAGDAYIAGSTTSANFPVTSGAYQQIFATSANPQFDVFISELNPSGTALLYSTYLGGNSSDMASGIALDHAGTIYVVGSAGKNFPTTPGAYNNSSGSSFISKLNSAGHGASDLIYSTFLGTGVDNTKGIAVDGAGNVYITGYTGSSEHEDYERSIPDDVWWQFLRRLYLQVQSVW